MTTLLVIEDDPSNTRLISMVLRERPYTLVEVTTSERGIETLQTRQIDLILLDLRLPGMNGWEFARTVKAHPQWRQIPLIAVSAPTSAQDQQQAFEAGCDAFIAKPFRPGQLSSIIGQFLSA